MVTSSSNSLFLYREWFFNLLVAAYYLHFAHMHASYYLQEGALTTLLFLIYESLIIFLALIRRMPQDVSFKLRDWIVAGIGTYAPLMMISQHHDFAGSEILLGLQFAGILISFLGMCSLNRSYGTVPANRGIRTKGLYAYVRHPVYAGYFLSITCFALQNTGDQSAAAWNIFLLSTTLLALIFRIRYEEELLMKDEAYQQFASTTRYRLLPGIW